MIFPGEFIAGVISFFGFLGFPLMGLFIHLIFIGIVLFIVVKIMKKLFH